MAEVFDVVYNIQVMSEQATLGINKFTQATSGLTKAAANLEKFASTFNQINAMTKNGFMLRVDANQALKKLQQVENKVREIRNLAKGITIGAAGGTSSTRSGKQSTPRQAVAPTPAPVRQPRQQAYRAPQPKQVAMPMPKTMLPSNLQYQVLGPTRLGNVAMFDMFKGMGLMYGISAIGSGFRDILTTSAEYQNIMQTAKNILKTNYKGGGFEASFTEMERIARQVGVETKFTAPEVADAVKFFAMAGLDMDAIKKSIRPVADIALIGDTDLGTTADVMTNIMTAYRIKPEEMRKTADIMARTFTMSNTTLMELAESFKMSGSVLQQYGVPFEEAAAAFGVLGDAGIKSTMAGTTMRTIIANLRKPSKAQLDYWSSLGVRRIDEFGNRRNLIDIFADLSRVNNERGQADKALEEYRKLREAYDPKFDVLQEGSEEWRKLELEYNKKSDEIQKAFGGVDVFRLFRLTAASGGGVLVDSIDKWNKIMQENFMSAGISEKLANEKKNQIVGLWAQVKSAFQEAGLKVFEENDDRIRGYLNRGISYLKSARFTDMLRSVFDLVADLGGLLLKFTRAIVYLYDKFGPLIKRFLEFQLILKGIQTVVASFKQFNNAVLYLTTFGRAGALTYGNRMIAGTAYPGINGGMVYGFGSRLLYGDPLKQAMRDKNWMNPADNDIIVAHRKNRMLLQRYQSRRNEKMANMQKYSGIGMFGGSIIGGLIGNNFDEDNGMMWGSMVGMGLGSMAPLLVGSGPWGWAIGGAVVAITGITSAIVKYQREMAKAKQETESYLASLRTLNIGKMDLSSADAVFNANIRITTSLLHTENEKLELQAELWKRIREEREGTQDNYDKGTSRDVIQRMKDYRNKYWYSDLWASPSKQDAFMLSRKALLGELENAGLFSSVTFNERDARNRYKLTDGNGNEAVYTGLINGKTYNAWDKEYINSFAALSAAFDPENPFVNNARQSMLNKMLGLTSSEGYDDAIAQFWNEFGFSIDQSKKINKLKDSDFDALLSDNGLLAYPEYGVPIMMQLESIAKGFEAQRELLNLTKDFDFEVDKLVMPMASTQKVLNTFIGELFDPSRFGQFGTYDWINKVRDYANSTQMGIDQYGNIVDVPVFAGGLEGDMFNKQVQEVYSQFQGFFEKLPKNIQPFYYPYLDKGYWESIGGSVNLEEFNGLSSDLQKKYGALKVTPSPFLSPFMPQDDTLPSTLFERPLYYPNSINDALAQTSKGAVEQKNTTINNITVHFDKALNIENVNQADWDSEEKAEYVANVVVGVLSNACEQFCIANE